MKGYTKPILVPSSELAEGVYLASGDAGCYTVTHNIHQAPQLGRGDYRIQFNATHTATHHSGEQTLIIAFNQPVTYVSSNGTLAGGNNPSSLAIKYTYHNNDNDYIGLGDVVVNAETGLLVLDAQLKCNGDCFQH